MRKFLALTLALVFALCLGVPALAADAYTVTLINGMDGSVHATYQVAAGEDFIFTISCAAPADMGPVAAGEAGSGVTTTVGTIAYSNITTGGPNAYPTAETVTISGINADATVTVTPNPDEVDSVFPTITEGGSAGSTSGEASGEASEDPYPMFDEYKTYLYETLMQDSFWQGNEANLLAGLEAAETPEDESIQNFTGSGEVDQAPAGVVFPMTYDEWYAINGASGEASGEAAGDTSEAAYQAYLIEFVGSCEDIQTSGAANEYIALIQAGDYVSFPVEMLFNPQWFGEAALTLDEFVAAGGVATVAEHPSNGQMLDGTSA